MAPVRMLISMLLGAVIIRGGIARVSVAALRLWIAG